MKSATSFLERSIAQSVLAALSLPTRFFWWPLGACDALLAKNILIESTQQRLVLAAKALIRVAHHFCRHESLPIRKMLIMLDDLRLDVVKFAVNLQCLLAATFGTIALYIPHVKRNRLLATELRLSPVNRNPAHHRHHAMVPSPRHSVSWSLPSPYSCSHRTEC